MTTSGAQILFGALPLLSSDPVGEYTIEATADNTDWGNPAAVVADVASMLMDGDKAEVTRYGNRVATIGLRIKGATLDDVTAGQNAVEVEVNRGRNTLTWLPPGWSTASVFDVVYSTLDFRFDDLAETKHITRYFTLTLMCLPHARRDTPTTVVAAPVPAGDPVVTSIDPCTSTDGWSAPGLTLSTAGGAVVISDIPQVADGGAITVVKSGLAATIPGGSFVTIEWERSRAFAGFRTSAGSQMNPVAIEPVSSNRWKYYFHVNSPFTGFQIDTAGDGSGGLTGQIKIHDISEVDRLPVAGTPRQRSFTAEVGGTARTTADIVIESEDGLGDEVFVYSAPWGAAIDPPLRRWFADGGSLAADAISGRENSALDGVGASIPASLLPPGMHLVVARLKLNSGPAADVDVYLSASVTGIPWADPATNVSELMVVNVGTEYAFYPLGVVTLPTAAVDPETGATVVVGVQVDHPSAVLDDIWIYNLDAGVLTWMTDLTNTSDDTPTKVEIRSVTIDRNNPAWFVGTAGTDADNVDASARATSAGVHEVGPGLMNIFVITPGAEEQTVTLANLYERFHTHVPPPES